MPVDNFDSIWEIYNHISNKDYPLRSSDWKILDPISDNAIRFTIINGIPNLIISGVRNQYKDDPPTTTSLIIDPTGNIAPNPTLESKYTSRYTSRYTSIWEFVAAIKTRQLLYRAKNHIICDNGVEFDLSPKTKMTITILDEHVYVKILDVLLMQIEGKPSRGIPYIRGGSCYPQLAIAPMPSVSIPEDFNIQLEAI